MPYAPQCTTPLFYSTTTNASETNSTPETLPPSISLDRALEELKLIVSGDTSHANSTSCKNLVQNILDGNSPKATTELHKVRAALFQHLIKNNDPHRLDIIISILSTIGPKAITKKDFAAKLRCTIDLEPQSIETTLAESVKLFTHKSVLELLYSTIKQLQTLPNSSLLPAIPDKSLFSFELYSSIILKQVGTVRLLNKQLYKTERTILTNMIKFEKSEDLIRILEMMIKKNSTLNARLVSTIIDICHEVYDFESVINVWKMMDRLQVTTPFDLHRAMKAYLKLNQPQEALKVYESNPQIHQDWLFDLVLEAYGLSEDWVGMRNTFDSLFGRGELPNLNHYRIVITAISRIAQTDVIQFLYENLLSRDMKPNVNIHNAIMYGYYALGDLDGVKASFKILCDSGVSPNTNSYNIMLMIYRDLKDLKSAQDVLRAALAQGAISKVLLTTIVSLCAERRDPVNGEIVFNWIVEAGYHPDLTSFNALLHCFVEARMNKKVIALHRRMQKLGIPLRIDTATILLSHYSGTLDHDSISLLLNEMNHEGVSRDKYFYSELLEYFCKSNRMEDAEMLMEEMSISGNITPDIYHYSILMKGYLERKNFSKVLETYDILGNHGLKPSFHTSALVLEAIQRSSKDLPELKGRSADLLSEFLLNKDSIDLTSEHLPRNGVPPELSKIVARRFADQGKPDEILKIAAQMKDQHNGKYDIEKDVILMRKLLESYGRARDWENFSLYWIKFFEAQRQLYVPREIIDNKNRSFKSTTDKIPLRDQYSNDQIFIYKIYQIFTFSEHMGVMDFLDAMRAEGYLFSNNLINMVIRLLAEEDSTIHNAYQLVEYYLMKPHLARIRWSPQMKQRKITPQQYLKKVGQYNIQQKTVDSLVRNFRRLVDITIKTSGGPNSITENEAIYSLSLKMGKTVHYFYETSTRSKFPFKHPKKRAVNR